MRVTGSVTECATIFAHIRATEIKAGLRIAQNGLVAAITAAGGDADVVAEFAQFFHLLRAYARFHEHAAAADGLDQVD